MKYVKLFETHEEYVTFTKSDDYIKPNVSYCDDNDEIHYNIIRPIDLHLTFEVVSSGTITIKASNANVSKTISYSTDDGNTWTDLTTTTTAQSLGGTLNVGDKVLIKGNNATYATSSDCNQFAGTAKFNAYGNMMSLIYGDNFANNNVFTADYVFSKLFSGTTGIVNAENLILPAKVLTVGCYYIMFKDCTSLITAPELPATTLADNCYRSMFGTCSNLTKIPNLPATATTESCYQYMFRNCSKLTTVPELPATTMASKCYYGMFANCTGLTTPQTVLGVSSTTVGSSACTWMFSGCTNMTSAPELPARTMSSASYLQMFANCTSLSISPELPATTLADNCYNHMYRGCINLTTPPTELPATTLAEACYYYMFNGCKSLASAPELPATTLADNCYQSMFNGCTGLTTAPDLPAITLSASAYTSMFQSCSSLNYIKMLATDISATNCLQNWVSGVAASGTFVKNSAAQWDVSGVNGIPTGWTVQTASA